MSKRKSRRVRRRVAEAAVSDRLNLRTAPPVRRVAGKIALSVSNLAKDRDKLAEWGAGNARAREAAEQLDAILQAFPTLEACLDDLELSGFSPPRLSYTAGAVVGDHVSVLEERRHLYSDIMAPELMLNMEVITKHPGKGGGLVVENPKGSRMKVAMSHVVKL